MNASEYIDHLKLEAHPEGGYFRETFRGAEKIQCAAGERNAGTAIYFLLESDNFSAFHRLKNDELWYYHDGAPTIIHIIHPGGRLEQIIMGKNLSEGHQLQVLLPSGTWFAAEVTGEKQFILISCSVSPGFAFEDFELAKADQLAKAFPEHELLIRRLCRI